MEMNRSLIVARLRNGRTEGDALMELHELIRSGSRELATLAKSVVRYRNWRDYYFGRPGHVGLTIGYSNICFAWPLPPSQRSIKKPVGKPYRERIVSSFNNLQAFINRIAYFGKNIVEEKLADFEWSEAIEMFLDVTLTAYERPYQDDPFKQREGLVLVEPDSNDFDEVRKEMIGLYREWKEQDGD